MTETIRFLKLSVLCRENESFDFVSKTISEALDISEFLWFEISEIIDPKTEKEIIDSINKLRNSEA